MRSRRILLVVLMLVAPAMIAAATHNFGHRLYIVGRVLDADGLPVSNADLQGEIEGLDVQLNEGPCRSNPCPTSTDGLGDYGSQLYWHAHGIGSSGTARITVEGQTFTADYDTDRRWTVLDARLDTTVDHDNETLDRWERSYRVGGRLWVDGGGLPDSQTTWVEGNVPGCMEAYGGGRQCVPVPVNVTLTLDDGRTLNRSTRTATGYGDFHVTFEADEPITGGEATVSAAGETFSFPLDTETRATTRVYELPGPDEGDFPWLILGGGVGVVAAGVAGYVGIQRWKDKRELEKARERSGRKRSN